MAKTKTADFLADCFEHYADTHRPYIYGTFGKVLTEALLLQKAKQYPSRLSPARVEYAKKHYIGKRTDDCVGGEKNVAWLPGNDPDADPVYDSKTDWSANTTYEKATVKGPISKIPKKRGICVWYNGHTGVLTDPDKGIVCEFRGFDYGCVRTKLSERKWTNYFEHPLFDYSKQPEPTPTFTPYKVKILVDALNYRNGPGLKYKINGVIRDKGGIYTIVDEAVDNRGVTWGKLKSGVGWISLKLTKKLK